MKFSIFSFLFIAFFSVSSCDGDTSTSTKKEEATKLGSIPAAEMKKMWDKIDYIDYLFYTTNFSVSQSNQSSARQFLSYISTEVSTVNPDCKPMGRVFFQADGEIMHQADFYVGETCNYLIFIEDNQPVYCNAFTPDGHNYFKLIFEQVKKMNAKNKSE